MKNLRLTILTLLLAIAAFASAQSPTFPFDPSLLSREDAITFVDMMVNLIDKDVSNQLKEDTGLTVSISVEDNVMYYNFHLHHFTSKGISPELTRFFIAMNRPDGERLEGITMLVSILEKAEYRIGYRYMDRDTLVATMEPHEFLHLMTTPIDELEFDCSEMLTQLIENLNAHAEEPDIRRNFSSFHTTIDGSYIAIHAVTNVPNPMLSDGNLDSRTRANIAYYLVKGPYAFSLKGLINAAKKLHMQGIKYDLSDPEGNQRIITLTWDDIYTLANGASDPDDPETTLDMADQFLSDDIAKHNLNVTFSHITEPTRLRLIISYDYTADQFKAIVQSTGEEALLSTYSTLLAQLLPQMPKIEDVTIELVNSDDERIVHTYPRTRFTPQ